MENDVRQIRLRISTKKNLIAQLQALYTSKNHIEKDLIGNYYATHFYVIYYFIREC